MPSKHTDFLNTKSETYCYQNIKTVITQKQENANTFKTMNGAIGEKR